MSLSIYNYFISNFLCYNEEYEKDYSEDQNSYEDENRATGVGISHQKISASKNFCEDSERDISKTSVHTCNEIIVAEDNDKTQYKYKDYFTHNKIPYSAFSNGKDCLAYIKSIYNDCDNCKKLMVITDSKMPLMDGLELANNLKYMRNKKINLILATAEGDDNQSGLFDKIIQKPLDMRDIHFAYNEFYFNVKSSKMVSLSKQQYYALALREKSDELQVYEIERDLKSSDENPKNSQFQNEELSHVCHEVLLVEDYVKTLKSYTDYLDSKKVYYKTFKNGKECEQYFKNSNAYECMYCEKLLVITDYYMPIMNGVQLSESIRESGCMKSIFIALLSADEVYGSEKLIDQFLYKPATGRDIYEIYQKFYMDEILSRQEKDIYYLKELKKDYSAVKKENDSLRRMKSQQSERSYHLSKHVCNALLICEDHESTLNKYAAYLEKEQIPYITFENGRECLEYINCTSTSDCLKCSRIPIVTDYFMPLMNGLELAKEIRALNINKVFDLTLVSADEVYESDKYIDTFKEKPMPVEDLKTIYKQVITTGKHDSVSYD